MRASVHSSVVEFLSGLDFCSGYKERTLDLVISISLACSLTQWPRMSNEVFPLRLAAACEGPETASVIREELRKFIEADKMAESVNTQWCQVVRRRSAASHTLVQDLARVTVSDSVFVSHMRDLFGTFCFTFNEEGFSRLRQSEAQRHEAEFFP